MITLTRMLKYTSGNLTQLRLAAVVLLLSVCGMSAQNLTVKGTILASDTGTPLPMANVNIKGSAAGIASDIDGNYSVSAKSGDILVFSYVGFTDKEVTLTNQTVLNVTLEPDANTLNEVVVIGYGTQRKSDLTGAVSVVNVEDAKKTVTYDVAKMLQGQVAGVTVQSSGEPGGFVNIKIRGASSFTNNNPTFVIDGVIVDSPYDFAPGDIESIQVLKDASSTAIYGVRGANGVVIITTKKGKAGKLTVNLKSLAGYQTVGRRWSLTNREQYQQITNVAWLADNATLLPANDPNSPSFINNVDTDWQDSAFRSGSIQNQSVTFSGGTDVLSYNVNIDRFLQQSYMETPQDYQRYSANANITGTKGKFRFGAKMAFTSSTKDGFTEYLAGTSGILNLLQAIPTMPVYDPNRLGGYGGTDNSTQRAIALNVIGWQNLVSSTGNRERFIGNVWGEYEILPGLKFTLRASGDILNYTNRLWIPPSDLGWYYVTESNEAILDFNNGRNQRTIIDNLLNFDRTFGKHRVEALAGYVQERFDDEWIHAKGTGYTPETIPRLQYATQDNFSEDFTATETRSSWLARINYTFDDRYILTANFRQDKSSLFPEDINTGNFYSFSGAWKIHSDFKLPEWWNTAKVRGGYGLIGNNTVGRYSFAQTVNAFASYLFADPVTGEVLAPGTTNVTRLDQNISWEETTTVNGALELGFFNNKLQFTAEYFVKTSDELLARVPLPFSSGSFPSDIITNAGKMRNKGLEFTLGYVNNDKEFKYGINANLGTIKNEVLQIGFDNNPISNPGQASRTEVGRSLGELYVWVADGIFQNQDEIDAHATQPNAAPGDVRFRDINADGQINDEDRTFVGKTIPKYTYGLNMNASFKGFDASVFFQGAGGHKAYNNTYNLLMLGGLTNHHTDMLNYWTPDNPNTNVPRPHYLDPNGNARQSTRFVQNADYVKLQNAEIGYTLPLKKELVISRARLYLSGQNLFVISKYKGYDPDFNSNDGLFTRGFDNGSFPNPRTILFGVDVTF